MGKVFKLRKSPRVFVVVGFQAGVTVVAGGQRKSLITLLSDPISANFNLNQFITCLAENDSMP